MSYAVIAAAPGSLSISVYILLMYFGMNSVVWNDVALDGVTMQRIKELPQVDTEVSDRRTRPEAGARARRAARRRAPWLRD